MTKRIPLAVGIRQAISADISRMLDVLAACKLDLERKGIYQWTDEYPNAAYFEDKLAQSQLYVLEGEEGVAGAFVLDEYQIPEWSQATWVYEEGRYLVLHALFVHPEAQGGGMGKKVLNFCEETARAGDYDGLRFDVFTENETALAFYVKQGYSHRGDIILPFKPEGHQRYCCFEKIVSARLG
ncbi:GNAT family N-acetyltransferase [Cohnella sp. REN36]|uniref:GNAT family N-acetyltransferase n=1 Tax=Cohnella sp. REN36 TaxID=2887347 RepID=UPI001D150FEC|nr:GNAT family N-acetyltransferase [Cohnella sp. REN36]MCC3375536.1 GNAT family N-acetyltransferase [Cohnella sp. REN36]